MKQVVIILHSNLKIPVHFILQCNYASVGKLLFEVSMDIIPEGVLPISKFDDEVPPPIPPKMFEDDPEDLQQTEMM